MQIKSAIRIYASLLYEINICNSNEKNHCGGRYAMILINRNKTA